VVAGVDAIEFLGLLRSCGWIWSVMHVSGCRFLLIQYCSPLPSYILSSAHDITVEITIPYPTGIILFSPLRIISPLAHSVINSEISPCRLERTKNTTTYSRSSSLGILAWESPTCCLDLLAMNSTLSQNPPSVSSLPPSRFRPRGRQSRPRFGIPLGRSAIVLLPRHTTGEGLLEYVTLFKWNLSCSPHPMTYYNPHRYSENQGGGRGIAGV
jgi:hypothetical protein